MLEVHPGGRVEAASMRVLGALTARLPVIGQLGAVGWHDSQLPHGSHQFLKNMSYIDTCAKSVASLSLRESWAGRGSLFGRPRHLEGRAGQLLALAVTHLTFFQGCKLSSLPSAGLHTPPLWGVA